MSLLFNTTINNQTVKLLIVEEKERSFDILVLRCGNDEATCLLFKMDNVSFSTALEAIKFIKNDSTEQIDYISKNHHKSVTMVEDLKKQVQLCDTLLA